MEFFKFAGSILPRLIEAAGTTLELTACAITLGFIVGIFLALGRVYGNRPIRAVTSVYVQFFRGTPLLAQLLLIYYGLPPYLAMVGLKITPFVAAVFGLGLNSAAYQAEYFRGAIQSIESGQMMAARSIGLSKVKAIRHVILPQALRILPLPDRAHVRGEEDRPSHGADVRHLRDRRAHLPRHRPRRIPPPPDAGEPGPRPRTRRECRA